MKNRYWNLAVGLTAVLWLGGCASCIDSGTSGLDGSAVRDSGDSEIDAGPLAHVDAGLVTTPEDAGANPFDPDNDKKDSDCDGLTNAEEFSTLYSNGKLTDATKADTDGDGILDGVEAGRTKSVAAECSSFSGDLDTATRTSPVEADSDRDGLPDGIEDANKNGRRDANETSPLDPDSDGDGLTDGAEDANANGQVDARESNPMSKDSDGDGINDGVERNITLTDPTNADTDNDGCSDSAEDMDQDGVVDQGETNPKLGTDCGPANVRDTDNDGILDRVEDTNGNGLYEPALGETNWNAADTDGDGLNDGLEDKNKNGVVDTRETNPRTPDSDCDGLIDGPTIVAILGEDLNANGQVDANETDPLNADTDNDGIRDGVERGNVINRDPARCTGFIPDADPTTTTNPVKDDTDNDGIKDGAEDSNQNGRVDNGELDPNNPADAGGPTAQACATNNLRPVVFSSESESDVQLALPATFTELVPLVVGGKKQGLLGYDATTKVAFVAFRDAPVAGSPTPSSDEAALRRKLNGFATISTPTTQLFTTWDGVPAIQAIYEQAGTADLKAHANALATALLSGSSGALAGSGGAVGPFKMQVEIAHRSAQSVIYIIALTPQALFKEPAIFSISDTAGGSALAQFGDTTAVQCETFSPVTANTDFLFVVDDSGSMALHQQALSDTATAIASKLNNSTLDWRMALVTTSYLLTFDSMSNQEIMRGFSRNINQVQAWLTQNSTCVGGICTEVMNAPPCDSNGPALYQGANDGCWIGTQGNKNEGLLGSARRAIVDLTPSTSTEQIDRLRSDAQAVIIMLGDADDQTTGFGSTRESCVAMGNCENIQNFIDFFNNTGTVPLLTKNPLNKKIAVHGIQCADGAPCGGETVGNPRRDVTVINATGGIRGDIANSSSIAASIDAIITNTVNAGGHRTQKAPVGASIKLAMSDVLNPALCNKNDLPRSRINGFDFDGVTQRISFFGACRPPPNTSVQAAVSYRYWVDNSPLPNGSQPPCVNDPFFDPTQPDFCKGKLECNLANNTCQCPANCGGVAAPGQTCNTNPYVCDFVCTPDCGGACTGYQTCNTNSCACECLPNATCAPGFTFKNSDGVCGCVCDAAALGCGPRFQADLNACACVCKSDCGGCGQSELASCNTSLCACVSIPQ